MPIYSSLSEKQQHKVIDVLHKLVELNEKNTIIGTAQFGLNYGISNKTGIVSIKEISEILQTAANAGINTLDTAISYGDCDKKLGEIG